MLTYHLLREPGNSYWYKTPSSSFLRLYTLLLKTNSKMKQLKINGWKMKSPFLGTACFHLICFCFQGVVYNLKKIPIQNAIILPPRLNKLTKEKFYPPKIVWEFFCPQISWFSYISRYFTMALSQVGFLETDDVRHKRWVAWSRSGPQLHLAPQTSPGGCIRFGDMSHHGLWDS